MATATAAPPPPPLTPPAAPRWNTLQRLKGSRLLLLVMDGILTVLLLSAVQVHHDALHTVGQDAAPSIIAAQHIKAAIAAMDAEAGHELLTIPENGTSSLANYDAERAEAAGSLVTAAENITYGDSERGPIRTLQNGLSVYEDFVQRARDLHEEAATPENTAAPAGVLDAQRDAQREAQTMVDRSLLPAADDLDRANLTQLDSTYRRESVASVALRIVAVLVGLVTLFAFVATQLFLSRRTQRTFNIPLAVATVLLVIVTVVTVSYLSDAQLELRTAKQDAFNSIHALWQARAVAYQTASDESRFLLDPAHPAAAEAAFREHAATLAQLPPGSTSASLLAAEDANLPVTNLTGYLADELNNVTFPGEREAALKTLTDWERYVDVDTEVRRLERAGQHRAAVDLSTQSSGGGAAWALHQFDRSLTATLDLNQRVFTRSIAKGNAALSGLMLKVSLAAALIAILSVIGLAPRLREYQ